MARRSDRAMADLTGLSPGLRRRGLRQSAQAEAVQPHIRFQRGCGAVAGAQQAQRPLFCPQDRPGIALEQATRFPQREAEEVVQDNRVVLGFGQVVELIAHPGQQVGGAGGAHLKCRMSPCTGQAAASPSAQIVCPSICLVISHSMSISSSLQPGRANGRFKKVREVQGQGKGQREARAGRDALFRGANLVADCL